MIWATYLHAYCTLFVRSARRRYRETAIVSFVQAIHAWGTLRYLHVVCVIRQYKFLAHFWKFHTERNQSALRPVLLLQNVSIMEVDGISTSDKRQEELHIFIWFIEYESERYRENRWWEREWRPCRRTSTMLFFTDVAHASCTYPQSCQDYQERLVVSATSKSHTKWTSLSVICFTRYFNLIAIQMSDKSWPRH